MNQKINEADGTMQGKNRDITGLEEKENTLRQQIESLESDMEQKSKLLERLQELDKLGFGEKELEALHTTLAEIGSKRGIKPSEAVNGFFSELKDYDAKTGFGQEIQRLETITETKKLEAEKWQAEADKLSRRYKELSEAISAVHNLTKQGVKQEQIVSWNKSLTSLGEAEEFEKALNRYKSIQGLLAAKRREVKKLDLKIAKLNGEVNTLRQQKAEIEGSIKALKSSAITQIERVSRTGVETLKAQKGEIEGSIKTFKASALKEIGELSQTGVEKVDKLTETGNSSIRAVGETALSELKEALSLVDELSRRALEVGEIIGQLETKLDKSKELRDRTEKLVTGIETNR